MTVVLMVEPGGITVQGKVGLFWQCPTIYTSTLSSKVRLSGTFMVPQARLQLTHCHAQSLLQ